MVQRYRRGFTTAERTEMWDSWQRGESLRAIGRTFGRHCQIKIFFDDVVAFS
jgi:hypothetical protein